MNKLIKYFHPKQEISYLYKLKTNFFIIQAYIIIILLSSIIIFDFVFPSENFIFSFFSKISAILFLIINLFILKIKGIKIAGNIYSFVTVALLLIWINILTEDISPIYKYTQGFYSILASLVVGVLFASSPIIIANAVLIFITTTHVFIFTKSHSPVDDSIFTIGYIVHSSTLIFITTILYFTNKFTEATIKKAKRSEVKFKQLSDLTFEGILIHDKGIAIDVNLSFAKIFGYRSDELIGKNIIKLLVHEDYHKIISDNIIKNETLPYEIKGIKKDGSIIHLKLESRNFKSDDTNKIIRVTAVRDISVRKQAEKEINKLSMAVEQSANTIVITDLNGNIEYVNSKFSELTGYTAQEVLGQNTRILNAKTQSKKYYIDLWETITAGNVWKGEFHNKKKNDEYYWEQVTITPIKNKTGKTTNYLAIKEDITAIKKAKETIKKEYARFKNIMDINPAGIYIIDKQHNIEYVNPVIKKEFGQIDGRKCYSYFHDLSEVCKWCKNKEVFAGKSVRWECFSKKNNKHYDLFDAPITNPDGTVSKFVLIFDITDRKKAEQKLQKQNIEYASLNEEYKTQNEELIIAKEKAEKNKNQIQLITDNFVNSMIYQVAMLDKNKRKFNYISESVYSLYGCTSDEAKENPNLIYSKIHKDDISILK